MLGPRRAGTGGVEAVAHAVPEWGARQVRARRGGGRGVHRAPEGRKGIVLLARATQRLSDLEGHRRREERVHCAHVQRIENRLGGRASGACERRVVPRPHLLRE